MPGDTLAVSATPARERATGPPCVSRGAAALAGVDPDRGRPTTAAAVVGRPSRFGRAPEPVSAPAATSIVPPTTIETPAPQFSCDGRTTCSKMHSCEEATWMSNHCTGTKMDGNHDGVPCEQQWCTGVH